ncbi:MAG: histidine kinase, partial [Deltaproteobacteria bacterium]|nr:histidine kinase [Deltaproteobacteria bacterium]
MAQPNISSNSRLIILSLIIAYSIFLSACLNDAPRRIAPKADKGILDLTDWDLREDGPVDLSGEWEFYWSRHLSPSDFSKENLPDNKEFIKVPGYWKNNEISGS